MSNAKKKADELFRYEALVDSISSDEEKIGFDAFSNSNRGNDKNNKRKPSFSKKEEKETKKLKHDYSTEEEDDLVIMNATNKINNNNNNNNNSNNNNKKSKKKTENPYNDLLDRIDIEDRSLSLKTNQIDPAFQVSLNKSKQIRDSIEQTRKSLNNQSNMLDLVDDDDSETTVVKITINYAEKNRQFIFAVKKMEKFELLSEKLGNILNVPPNHIQFKLYSVLIDLKKCPSDYGLMNNEKLTMTVKAPSTKPQATIQKVILEDDNENFEEADDDEYRKELERIISGAQNPAKKPDNGPKKITLHVCIPGQVKHQKFKILPTDKFAKIIEAIYSEIGKRIKLQFEGETIDPESVPNDYDMEGGEQIDGKW